MTEKDFPDELTDRQLKAIPYLVSSPTLEEGRKKARVSKNALFTWLRDPVFKNELQRQRNVVITEALEILKGHLVKATESLVDLLETDSDSLRRHVANDIIGHALKWKEIEDLEKRLCDVEQLIFSQRK